jgi:hypothetical protein
MNPINRRRFLALAAAGSGTLFLPTGAFAFFRPQNENEADPHFFLQIILNGGADATYLYDARPGEMTAGKLIQNYNPAPAIPYAGFNGGSCLLPDSSKALRPFLDRFTIVNGVVMNPTFDGHDQNMNIFMTGSPTGGASFMPALCAGAGFPLDGVQNGVLKANVNNHGHVVPLDPATASLLQDKLSAAAPILPGSELHNYISGRFTANASGGGRFSRGSAAMLAGFQDCGTLRDRLLGLEKPSHDLKPEEQFVSMLGSIFRNKMAGTALWVFEENFDVHAVEDAKSQPKTFTIATERLALIFRAMAATPFDQTRSLLDVTTVVVNSEFSRSMRQLQKPIDNTGTDHNQLGNSFLLGGKGIRGGQVIGATDMATLEEKPSAVHKTFDPNGLKLIGRAFDFAAQKNIDPPPAYDVKKYLTSDSVVNTIYSLFGTNRSLYRTMDRDGTLAPVLTSLLS